MPFVAEVLGKLRPPAANKRAAADATTPGEAMDKCKAAQGAMPQETVNAESRKDELELRSSEADLPRRGGRALNGNVGRAHSADKHPRVGRWACRRAAQVARMSLVSAGRRGDKRRREMCRREDCVRRVL